MITWTVSTRSPGRLRSFDPLRVGDLEYRMWVSYYRRNWLRVLLAAVRLAWLGFGADWLLILQSAALLMRAVILWAPFPATCCGRGSRWPRAIIAPRSSTCRIPHWRT